jgi:hypothetical protein
MKLHQTLHKCAHRVVCGYLAMYHFPREHKSMLAAHAIAVVALIAGLFGYHSVANLAHGGSLTFILHHSFTTGGDIENA